MKKSILMVGLMSLLIISMVCAAPLALNSEKENTWAQIEKLIGMKITEIQDQELPGFIKTLFSNEKINIYITLENNQNLSFGAVTQNGKLSELSQKILTEPTLNVYATEKVIQEIQSSINPLIALKKALDEGKITYEAVTIGNKFKLGIAKIFLKVSGWFS